MFLPKALESAVNFFLDGVLEVRRFFNLGASRALTETAAEEPRRIHERDDGIRKHDKTIGGWVFGPKIAGETDLFSPERRGVRPGLLQRYHKRSLERQSFDSSEHKTTRPTSLQGYESVAIRGF